jgi:hypothetical protein
MRAAPARLRALRAATLVVAAALLGPLPAEAQGPSHAILQIHFLDPVAGTMIRTDSYSLADPGAGSIGDWAGRFWVQQDPLVAGRRDPLVVVAYEVLVPPGGARRSRFAVLRYDGSRFTIRQFMDVGPPEHEVFFLRVFAVGAAIFMEIYEGTDPSALPGALDAHDYAWDGAAFVEIGVREDVALPAPLESLPMTPEGEMQVGPGLGQPFRVSTNSSIPGGSRVLLVEAPSPEILAVEADPKGGRYAATLAVVLSSNSPTATIRYTADGSEPIPASPIFDPGTPIYVMPCDAAGSCQALRTLKFQAAEAGRPSSPVVSETYEVIQPKAADTDGDGLLDIWEAGRCVRFCRRPGACDLAEFEPDHCFDPLVADADVDCDLDGWSDFDELRLGLGLAVPYDPSCGDSKPAPGAERRQVRFSGSAARPDGDFVEDSHIEMISPRGADLLSRPAPPVPTTDIGGLFTDVPTRGEADLILRIADASEPQVVLHRMVPFLEWSALLPRRVFADGEFTGADDWFMKYADALQYDIALGGIAVDARSSAVVQLVEDDVEDRLPALVLDYIGIPIEDLDRPPLGNFPTLADGDIDLNGNGAFDPFRLTLGERAAGLTGTQARVLLRGTDLALLQAGIQSDAVDNPDGTYGAWIALAEDIFRALPLVETFHGTTDEVLTDLLDDPLSLPADLAAAIDALPLLGGEGGEARAATGREDATVAAVGPAPRVLPADLPGLVAAVKAAVATTAAIYGRVVARGERGVYEAGDAFASGAEYRGIVAALVGERAGVIPALQDIAAGAEEAARAVEEARILAALGRIAAVQNLKTGIGVLAAALDAANGDAAALANLNARMAGLVYRIDRAAGDPAALALLEATAADFLQPDLVPPVVTASPAGPLFTGSVDVTLLSDEPATIHFTLDGSDPVPGSPGTFAGSNEIAGILITRDTTLSWIGIDDPWMNASAVSRIAYRSDADADGVADAADNCPLAPNPFQEDFDGDLLGDACDPNDDNDPFDDLADCRPLDLTLWAAPGESPITIDFPDRDTLQWTSLAAAAGPATLYDIARGPLSDLRGGRPPGNEFDGAICLYNDRAAPPLTATDADVPAPGEGFYYLIRGDNACGIGSYGRGSGGAERVTLACP